MRQGYYNWGNRIFVNWSLLEHGWDGELICTFSYVNVKSGKESEKIDFTLDQAIRLAEMRRDDGRYRNYEFYIG